MGEYADKSGLFADFNFKLVVINSLLELHPSFEADLAALKKQYIDPADPFVFREGPLSEVVDFFQALRLTDEDLDKVTRLDFDGGEDIYRLLKPDWDGEEDLFDVSSVQGFERLKNLKFVFWCAMCDKALLESFRKQGIQLNQ